jgi:phosphoglycerate dehydrogenase-like enzyme
MHESPRLTVAVTVGRHRDAMVPYLQSCMPDAEVVASSADGEPCAAEVVVTLLDDEATRDLRAALTPSVRWVHVFAAGVDGFPFDALGERLLTCSRGASAPAIAEFTLASMLEFEKRLSEVWITAEPERWGTASLGGLRGRTLAVVGLGAIGTAIARRALAFDMDVVAVRRSDAPPPLPDITVSASLHDALADADHVVVAAAATDATRRLFDTKAFAAMKRGTHFVNIARGSLVDQDALLQALDEGTVARASLDVTDPEPLPTGHPLYGHPHVHVTPHISWNSPDTVARTVNLLIDNLRRYLADEPLHGRVDPAHGY